MSTKEDEEKHLDQAIRAVSDALPRGLLAKSDYAPVSEGSERHGSTEWIWHKYDSATELHRFVTMALLIRLDGSIELSEFWIGASQDRRFTRRSIYSRPIDVYNLHDEFDRLFSQTIKSAGELSVGDLDNVRPFDVNPYSP